MVSYQSNVAFDRYDSAYARGVISEVTIRKALLENGYDHRQFKEHLDAADDALFWVVMDYVKNLFEFLGCTVKMPDFEAWKRDYYFAKFCIEVNVPEFMCLKKKYIRKHVEEWNSILSHQMDWWNCAIHGKTLVYTIEEFYSSWPNIRYLIKNLIEWRAFISKELPANEKRDHYPLAGR